MRRVVAMRACDDDERQEAAAGRHQSPRGVVGRRSARGHVGPGPATRPCRDGLHSGAAPRQLQPDASSLWIHSETLANVMLHLSPRETCAAACASRGWRNAVAVNGRLRRVLHLGPHDCAWSAPVLNKLFARFSRLEELHLSTEMLVSLEAVAAIAACFAGSLRCFSGFVVSNVVQGRQPAVSELAKITALESLTLEGTLLTGYSLVELGHGCTALRRLHCPEILSSHADLCTLLHRCPRLEYLGAVNLSVHHEVTGPRGSQMASALHRTAPPSQCGECVGGLFATRPRKQLQLLATAIAGAS